MFNSIFLYLSISWYTSIFQFVQTISLINLETNLQMNLILFLRELVFVLWIAKNSPIGYDLSYLDSTTETRMDGVLSGAGDSLHACGQFLLNKAQHLCKNMSQLFKFFFVIKILSSFSQWKCADIITLNCSEIYS